VSDVSATGNRTDLQNPAKKVARRVATGQTYGKAAEQMAAQRAVPMGASPVEVPPARPRVNPGTLGSLTRPSDRPAEPITAGANFGPGPNAAAAGMPVPRINSALAELRAIYQMFPSDDLLDLIDSATREGI